MPRLLSKLTAGLAATIPSCAKCHACGEFGLWKCLDVADCAWARYNFYLDEMIAMRNRATVAKLEERGKSPVLVPEDVLKAEVALIPADH